MSDPSPTMQALARAGRRVAYHMIQAGIEGLKAIEAVIDEVGGIAERADEDGPPKDRRQRIEVE